MNQLRYRRGAPKRMYCGNGSEFTRPGKPSDNSHIESFNGRFRGECLNAHGFTSLAEAENTISAWLKDYNESRPHRGLNNLAPLEYVAQLENGA